MRGDACKSGTVMEALQFDISVPRTMAGKVLGAVYEPLFWSGLSCLRYGQADEPALPGPEKAVFAFD